jgi:hypothetical protein
MPPHNVSELAALVQVLARRIGATDIASAAAALTDSPPPSRSERWTQEMRAKAREKELLRRKLSREKHIPDAIESLKGFSFNADNDLTP